MRTGSWWEGKGLFTGCLSFPAQPRAEGAGQAEPVKPGALPGPRRCVMTHHLAVSQLVEHFLFRRGEELVGWHLGRRNCPPFTGVEPETQTGSAPPQSGLVPRTFLLQRTAITSIIIIIII